MLTIKLKTYLYALYKYKHVDEDMYMKNILILILLFGISSCVKNTPITPSKDTLLYEEVPPSKIQEKMGEINSDYYLVYLSIEESDEINQIFMDFGIQLNKKGLVLKINTENKYNKKKYLNYVQKKLNKGYEYKASPFLIFYQKNNAYEPYKILSFGGLSEKCLKESLEKIDRRILNDSINNEINSISFISSMKACKITDYNGDISSLHDFVDFILAIYQDLT